MTETQEAPQPVTAPKTKEQRSQIAKDAALRRWAKTKREAAKAAKAKTQSKTAKKAAGPREFSSALKMAEKRLTKAIQERAESSAKYAVLSAEIPSLQRLIVALRNPLGVSPEYGQSMAPSLEQIVGDQPLPYQNPPRAAAPPPIPVIPVPQPLHPANQQGRAQGGAIGVELEEAGNEDQFLQESPLAGGSWH